MILNKITEECYLTELASHPQLGRLNAQIKILCNRCFRMASAASSFCWRVIIDGVRSPVLIRSSTVV